MSPSPELRKQSTNLTREGLSEMLGAGVSDAVIAEKIDKWFQMRLVKGNNNNNVPSLPDH